MSRTPTLVLALAACCSLASAGDRVVVVLDASGATGRPGVGGLPVAVSAREALAAVAAEAGEHGVELGLRLAGGGSGPGGVDSCAATPEAVPVGAVDPERFAEALDAIEPYGLRPLVTAVLAAAAGLEPVDGGRRVVVVTAGDDQCWRGPQAVAAALASLDDPPELRLVGLGLEASVVDRYGAVPHRNATSAEELLDALRWAVLDDTGHRRGGGLVVGSLGGPEVATSRIELTDLATGTVETPKAAAGARLELAAGRYRVAVADEDAPRVELADVLVVAGADTRLELEAGPADELWLDVVPEGPGAGAWLRVDVFGKTAEGAVLALTANGRALAPPRPLDAGGAWLTAPRRPGDIELLLLGPRRGGGRRVLARRPLTVSLAGPSLEAPSEAPAEGLLTAAWNGPGAAGDAVALVPRGGDASATVVCAPVGVDREITLATPQTEGELDLVYVDGATWTVTARVPVRIAGPAASIEAPPAVSPGDLVEVDWQGPERDQDFVAVAPAGSPDKDYLGWAPVADGNPAAVRAPTSPGTYELRYVDGTTGEVRARAPLEVVPVRISIRAPAVATAGLRFEVAWTGPAGNGDFIAIANPSAPPDRYTDWASVSTGSPVTLAAPARPGSYEVRYVTAAGREVAASRPIEVRP